MAKAEVVAPRSRMFNTHIDLPAEQRVKVIALLNQQLADTFDLYSQTKQAHWNVKGMHFYQLHLLFDSLASSMLGFVDLIAERATALGGVAQGTARMAVSASTLPEYLPEAIDGKHHLEALIIRYAAYAASTRAAISACDELGDLDTADLFTQVSRDVDKDLWFLEAHLQG
ncbi:MAG TPA: DNA starvation/stationary phase protection protein Dps [Ktedonobacterales bacterium]|nr:DNA starvation/stationary phase protection protein Dps [Ktedonobacterales bacterium]